MKWKIIYDQGDYGSSRFNVTGNELIRVIRYGTEETGDFITGIIVDDVQIDVPGYIEDIILCGEESK